MQKYTISSGTVMQLNLMDKPNQFHRDQRKEGFFSCLCTAAKNGGSSTKSEIFIVKRKINLTSILKPAGIIFTVKSLVLFCLQWESE